MQWCNEATAISDGTSSSFVWTSTSIGRFWDLVANEPGLQQLYFSRQTATYLIEFAQYAGLDRGPVLDYGCGPGYLAKALVERGYNTMAVEFSKSSAERVNKLIPPAANWHGCVVAKSLPTPLPEDNFSWIFSIETYEHLLDEWIEGYFHDMFRILKPGGCLLLTTPHMENLDDQLIVCPACEVRFHRWGHLRSVTRDELTCRARDAGYEVLFCRAIDLRTVGCSLERPSIKELSIGTLGDWVKDRYRRFLERRRTPQFPNQHQVRTISSGPHLVLIGKRRL
jgi:SAM-dependent methyltransferase